MQEEQRKKIQIQAIEWIEKLKGWTAFAAEVERTMQRVKNEWEVSVMLRSPHLTVSEGVRVRYFLQRPSAARRVRRTMQKAAVIM